MLCVLNKHPVSIKVEFELLISFIYKKIFYKKDSIDPVETFLLIYKVTLKLCLKGQWKN